MNVVFLGNFNPMIFQPEWFRPLLPASEIDHAVENPGKALLTSDFVQIEFESVRLEVVHNRFLLGTTRRDWQDDIGAIAGSVFACLPHTPVKTFGMNFNEHRRQSASDHKALFERWVPITDLAALAGDEPSSRGWARGTWDGYRATIDLQPSLRFLPKPGVFLGQNYERDIKSLDQAIKSLDGEWKRAMKRSGEVWATLLSEPHGGIS